MLIPERQRFTTTQGITLSYLEWTPLSKNYSATAIQGQDIQEQDIQEQSHLPQKQPLLLLHGMADHAGVWAEVGETLSDRYHIIAPDLRGHGESDKPKTGYGFAEAIADISALMDAKGWTSAHILGHSWTGKMIAVWAKQAPERFRSLLLVDPAFINSLPRWTKITFPIFYKLLPFLKMLGPFDSRAAAEAQARQLKQYEAWTPLQQQVFEAAVEEKANGQWGSKFTIDAREPMFDDVMRVPGFTETIEIPTLLVQPTGGINKTEAQLKPYRKHLTNLDVCTLETSHWPFLTATDAFNQALSSFLDQQPSPQS